ncbi:glutamine--tRNA ligase/YqeY domain fusion protein [Candidatus Neomarinimicrobiota bacterium]
MSESKLGETKKSLDFIRTIVANDKITGKYAGRVHTRFPPEPNGYLHIGHAKAIYLDFTIAAENNGQTNLRFDDTNPVKEEHEYVQSIINDIHWLGFDWQDRLYYASDYFDTLYEYAEVLIQKGKAFVCDLSPSEIKEYRGTLTEPGKESPYRNRSIEENLKLFRAMKTGNYEDGSRVLRAKINMASGNLNMRDPIMYRILRSTHHRTGDKWCIYPTYDFTHGQSDSIENITHSMCTLEFEDHRPLYDWFLENIGIHHPQQIEFSPLVMSHTVQSKRKLRELVEEKYVEGWDDPRMPTLTGLRRRGVTPESIIKFVASSGVAKRQSIIDIAKFEHIIREELNKIVPRILAVLDPIKLVITNYPEGQVEELEAINNPEDPLMGSRKITFSKEIFIERSDFMEDPPNKYFRLAPGREVRLRYAYIVKCENVIRDNTTNEITEIHCTYDPNTKSGTGTQLRKVKGTIHWVSAGHAVDAKVRLYDRLYKVADPMKSSSSEDWKSNINPDSLRIVNNCKMESCVTNGKPGDRYQFERTGYFIIDHSSEEKNELIFNRTISLRDTWAKIEKAQK